MQPTLSPVIGHVKSAIRTQKEPVGIARIDPQIVVIEMENFRCMVEEMDQRALYALIGFSSILRGEEIVAKHVDFIFIVRRDADQAEIVSDARRQGLFVDLPPGCAPVIRAVHLPAHDAPLAHRVAELDLANVELGEWEEVVDPGGGDAEVFAACAAEVVDLVAALAPRLEGT